MNESDARAAVVAACREMNASGINQGTSGNIGLRFGDGLLITPSGMPYDEMVPDDVILMDASGEWRGRGDNQPSTEWRFHRDILRAKPEVGAVVHAHPLHCTILAIMGREIPALHYMIAVGGGPTIPCAPYATYGTEELSRHAVAALKGRTACLLAHHGLIATGGTLRKAMWLAVEVETLAHQYYGCLQLGGPPLLPDEEIDKILRQWGTYGIKEGADGPAEGRTALPADD